MQVVSPQGSELLHEENIPNPRYTVRVPIPSDIDRDGGSFEVALGKTRSSPYLQPLISNLASVEDAYGCKRTLTIPTVSVNVRRVKVSAPRLVSPSNLMRLVAYRQVLRQGEA